MARSQLKHRNENPNPTFSNKFEAALQSFSTSFLKTQPFLHALTKGEQREIPILDFFQEHLPTGYKVVSGVVIDKFNKQSPQLDLMIYDGSRNFALYSETASILPAEALLGSVEIKSMLTRNEIKKSLLAAQKLYQLRPFGESPTTTKKGGGKPEEFKCRYFHSVFAYSTDLSQNDWMQGEFNRVSDVASEVKIDASLIDRIYVVERGLLNIPSKLGMKENNDSAGAFLNYYMNVLNFLYRENKRREAVDYIEYAGRMTKGWTKLKG